MRPLLLLAMVPLADAAPCIAVDRDRVLAGDLAPAAPVFSAIDAGVTVGFTPFPGVARTFSARELAAVARKNGLQAASPLHEICVTRAVAALTRERIHAAMVSSLADDRAQLEITDYTRAPVPSGDLLFPRNRLMPPPAARPDAPALWRGLVQYGAGRTFPVWARVRVFLDARVVIAAREIRRGAELTAADIAQRERRVFPFAPRIESAADAVGQLARKTIAAGTILSPLAVEPAPDVRSGDTVQVVAAEGRARIRFEAVALSGGRRGDRILLRNPQTRLRFSAYVEGKGQARTGPGT